MRGQFRPPTKSAKRDHLSGRGRAEARIVVSNLECGDLSPLLIFALGNSPIVEKQKRR
jgi:hypothetical protein